MDSLKVADEFYLHIQVDGESHEREEGETRPPQLPEDSPGNHRNENEADINKAPRRMSLETATSYFTDLPSPTRLARDNRTDEGMWIQFYRSMSFG